MKFIKAGAPAPSFRVSSVNRGEVDLTQLLQASKVLLVFSRYWGCPVCQYEFDDLVAAKEALEARGILPVYINQSSEDRAREFLASRDDVWFPIIAATPRAGKHAYALYEEYGVGALGITALAGLAKKALKAKKRGIVHGPKEGFERQSPAQVLVDQDGVVRHARKGTLKLAAVFAAVDAVDAE